MIIHIPDGSLGVRPSLSTQKMHFESETLFPLLPCYESLTMYTGIP